MISRKWTSLAMCLIAAPAIAGTWEYRGGPGGGGAFHTVSAIGNNVWVTGDVGGAWKSADGGVSWTPIALQSAGLRKTHLTAVLMLASDTVIVGDDGDGLWRTTNGGTTFTRVLSENCYPNALIRAGTGNVLFAATQASFNDTTQ